MMLKSKMESINNREIEEQISEMVSKQLRREQLLEQRIKNLEAKIEAKEISDRIKHLERFQDLVIVLTVITIIYKIFI